MCVTCNLQLCGSGLMKLLKNESLHSALFTQGIDLKLNIDRKTQLI